MKIMEEFDLDIFGLGLTIIGHDNNNNNNNKMTTRQRGKSNQSRLLQKINIQHNTPYSTVDYPP